MSVEHVHAPTPPARRSISSEATRGARIRATEARNFAIFAAYRGYGYRGSPGPTLTSLAQRHGITRACAYQIVQRMRRAHVKLSDGPCQYVFALSARRCP